MFSLVSKKKERKRKENFKHEDFFPLPLKKPFRLSGPSAYQTPAYPDPGCKSKLGGISVPSVCPIFFSAMPKGMPMPECHSPDRHNSKQTFTLLGMDIGAQWMPNFFLCPWVCHAHAMTKGMPMPGCHSP
jgi:hypothetical protein